MLDMDREYFVLLLANEEGSPTALRARDDPRLGKVVRLFSSIGALKTWARQSDEPQRFMDMLEQMPEHFRSEDLETWCPTVTVRGLAPVLEALEVDHLEVDPLSAWNRVYPAPHKALPRS